MRIWISLFLLLISGAVTAQQSTETSAVPKFDFAAAATTYAVRAGDSDKDCEPFQIDLLKWTNPIRGTLAGSVFLWTQEGVPQAACCMYAYRSGEEFAVDHELVSLSTERIDVRQAAQPVWNTAMPGITWTPIPGAATPATNRPGRLLQMRKLATSFVGYLGVPTARQQELRLLPQPIYRFPDSADTDGGVFAFVQTTDPEVLLLLRANLQSQPAAWEFAAARMTMVHAFLMVEDKVVWSVPWWNRSRDATYITLARVPFSILAK